MSRRSTKPPGKDCAAAGPVITEATNVLETNQFKYRMSDGWRSNRDDFAAALFTVLGLPYLPQTGG